MASCYNNSSSQHHVPPFIHTCISPCLHFHVKAFFPNPYVSSHMISSSTSPSPPPSQPPLPLLSCFSLVASFARLLVVLKLDNLCFYLPNSSFPHSSSYPPSYTCSSSIMVFPSLFSILPLPPLFHPSLSLLSHLSLSLSLFPIQLFPASTSP